MAIVVALVAAGCSDDPEVEGAKTGDYAFEFKGADGLIDVTVDPAEDERLAEVEDYRKQVAMLTTDTEGVAPTYFAITVDNTDGDEQMEFSELVVVDDEGNQVTVQPVWSLIGEWGQTLDSEIEEQWRLSNDVGGPLYNDHLDDDDLAPGAKGTFYAATGDEVGEIERVYFSPYLGEQIEAERV